MNNNLQYMIADNKILLYKLNKIRNHIESRSKIVDVVTKNELAVILDMISQFEVVPNDWTLDKPLVVKEEE